MACGDVGVAVGRLSRPDGDGPAAGSRQRRPPARAAGPTAARRSTYPSTYKWDTQFPWASVAPRAARARGLAASRRSGNPARRVGLSPPPDAPRIRHRRPRSSRFAHLKSLNLLGGHRSCRHGALGGRAGPWSRPPPDGARPSRPPTRRREASGQTRGPGGAGRSLSKQLLCLAFFFVACLRADLFSAPVDPLADAPAPYRCPPRRGSDARGRSGADAVGVMFPLPLGSRLSSSKSRSRPAPGGPSRPRRRTRPRLFTPLWPPGCGAGRCGADAPSGDRRQTLSRSAPRPSMLFLGGLSAGVR